MSSTFSPITILEHTSHIHNKQHWQHDQYTQSNHCIRTYVPHTLQTTLTTCPVHSVQSLYYKICPTYITNNTDHMSSTYSPITILYPTTHLRNAQHWPHVQYVQSYHYIRSHHPLTEHTSLTTCPVRTVLSLYISHQPLTEHTYWPHVQYVQSFRYIISHHPLTKHTKHWPHVQYVQSYHYIRSHHPLTKHT